MIHNDYFLYIGDIKPLLMQIENEDCFVKLDFEYVRGYAQKLFVNKFLNGGSKNNEENIYLTYKNKDGNLWVRKYIIKTKEYIDDSFVLLAIGESEFITGEKDRLMY